HVLRVGRLIAAVTASRIGPGGVGGWATPNRGVCAAGAGASLVRRRKAGTPSSTGPLGAVLCAGCGVDDGASAVGPLVTAWAIKGAAPPFCAGASSLGLARLRVGLAGSGAASRWGACSICCGAP